MKINNKKEIGKSNFIHLCNNTEVNIRGVVYDVIRYGDDTFEFVVKDTRKQRGESLDIKFKIFSFAEIQERLLDGRIVRL